MRQRSSSARRTGVEDGHEAVGWDIETKSTAMSNTQWIYSSVSKAGLWKKGVFRDSAEDFPEFSAQNMRTSVSGDYCR